MRNLDAIIIIYSTGEEAKSVKAQAEALASKCAGRASWVIAFGAANSSAAVNLNPPQTIGANAKIGVYVVGEAGGSWLSKRKSFFEFTHEGVSTLICGVLKAFQTPVLQKVSLVGCDLASGEQNCPVQVSACAGSFVQDLCAKLSSEGHTPKVAGWTGPIDVMTEDWQISDKQKTKDKNKNPPVTSYVGRKSVAFVGGGQYYSVSYNDQVDPNTNLLQNSYRNDHKFAYQVQNGSVAKLTLDEWHKNP